MSGRRQPTTRPHAPADQATRDPVVAYVRMSTDHQKYSTENQLDVLRRYAEDRGYEIIRVYEDSGRSGLRLDGREALQSLISTVSSGRADFQAILVYDVSRWGRFQNADEGAYHEYVCSRAGIRVHYCGEQFENDGSIGSNLLKTVKRVMAGEYSRELSVKVFAGQCRLVELGYRQGGNPGYGLRRLLIDEQGAPKGELSKGERKSLQTDRVVLIPGPEEECEIVREIYALFVLRGLSETQIAALLNARGVLTDFDRPWTRAAVHQILINEKYIGNNVYNRVSFKLKQRRVKNPREMWIRANDAFPAIVEEALFLRARQIVDARSQHLSDDDLLVKLRGLLQQKGVLSGFIIDECETMPSSGAYRHRFGSLLRAYQLIGYDPERDYRYIEINRRLRAAHPQFVADVISGIQTAGGRAEVDAATQLICVNDEFALSVVLARCSATVAGSLRWHVRLDAGLVPDVTIAVRMDEFNRRPQDYFLLPSLDITSEKLRLSEQNGLGLDAYRFDTLDYLFLMSRRAQLVEAL